MFWKPDDSRPCGPAPCACCQWWTLIDPRRWHAEMQTKMGWQLHNMTLILHHQGWWLSPLINRFFFSIPGGCLGFCPSTVWMDEWDLWFCGIFVSYPNFLETETQRICCCFFRFLPRLLFSHQYEQYPTNVLVCFKRQRLSILFLDASRGMIRNHRNPDPLIIQKGVSWNGGTPKTPQNGHFKEILISKSCPCFERIPSL